MKVNVDAETSPAYCALPDTLLLPSSIRLWFP